MSEENKCPLLLMAGLNPNGVPCAENVCTYWDGSQCVLRSIADNMGDIAVNGMKGEEK